VEGLLGLLVWVVVVCLLAYLVFYLLGMIPLPEPARVVVTILVALIFLIFIVQRFGLLVGI